MSDDCEQNTLCVCCNAGVGKSLETAVQKDCNFKYKQKYMKTLWYTGKDCVLNPQLSANLFLRATVSCEDCALLSKGQGLQD